MLVNEYKLSVVIYVPGKSKIYELRILKREMSDEKEFFERSTVRALI